MKMTRLILWNIKLQAKYGFYLLYAILTICYIVIFAAMPEQWKTPVTAILIFSDPAAMGLFFMGAVILLEKSERVNAAFSVLPLQPVEYVIAKVASFETISIVVAILLALAANTGNLLWVTIGTILSSAVFTLIGLIIATKISSLNQFIIATVPIELLAFIPAILHLFLETSEGENWYPSNVCIDLISGKEVTFAGILVILVLGGILTFAAQRCVQKMWRTEREVRL